MRYNPYEQWTLCFVESLLLNMACMIVSPLLTRQVKPRLFQGHTGENGVPVSRPILSVVSKSASSTHLWVSFLRTIYSVTFGQLST